MEDKNNKIYYLKCPIENIPRYIGITCQKLNRRLSRHIMGDDPSHLNDYKDRWINKLKKQNLKPEIICLLDGLTREEACKLEIKLIAEAKKLYPKKITNISEGGDRPNMTQETRDKIGKAHKGRIVSEKTRKKLSDILKQKNHMKGTRHSEEMKQKISDGVKKSLKKENILKANKAAMKKLCKKVIVCDIFLEKEIIFNSLSEAGKYFNINSSCICRTIKKNIVYKNRFKMKYYI